MANVKNIQAGTAAERILSVACELFYKQGYRATGINEVIKKSGVAKATFYSHYPTKDVLCLAYLKELKSGELASLENAISLADGPLARLLAIIESLETWLLETNFRGCGFLNMASEIPDPRDPLRKVGKELYDKIRKRVEELSEELIESDSKKYGHLNARDLTNNYMVSFAGAVALAEIYHAIWPVEHAFKTMQSLIEQ
jgi:AcrR family transcriptional regulator